MAIIKCPECGKDISDQAVSCPHCGYPLANKDGGHIGAHSASRIKENDSGLSPAEKFAMEAKWGYSKPQEPESARRINPISVAVGALALIILIVAVLSMNGNVVRYKGLPDQVASQVGYLSQFSENGPKVMVAVHVDWVNEGGDTVMMWDLDEDYIVGYAHLSEPVDNSCYGSVEITGTVTSCNGKDRLDLSDAVIEM